MITSVVERRGWRVANAEAIAHDLWSAGELPELTFAEQLTVLLIGFDLSFELRPNDRSIEIVPLKGVSKSTGLGAATKRTAAPPDSTRTKKDGRHVYTLRVQEQPVGRYCKSYRSGFIGTFRSMRTSIQSGREVTRHACLVFCRECRSGALARSVTAARRGWTIGWRMNRCESLLGGMKRNEAGVFL